MQQIKSETTDAVTRNAKKQFVDERWDIADAMREKAEASGAAQGPGAGLPRAGACHQRRDVDGTGQAARERARDQKAKASSEMRERKKQIKEQALQDDRPPSRPRPPSMTRSTVSSSCLMMRSSQWRRKRRVVAPQALLQLPHSLSPHRAARDHAVGTRDVERRGAAGS